MQLREGFAGSLSAFSPNIFPDLGTVPSAAQNKKQEDLETPETTFKEPEFSTLEYSLAWLPGIRGNS